MTPGSYAVVRYIADPARNEPLNVGILLWATDDFRVELDLDAIARVVRDHPWVERDTLVRIESSIRSQLEACDAGLDRYVQRFLMDHPGFPVSITEPRFTLLQEGEEALDAELASLLKRVVKPGRRTGGGSSFKPLARLEQRLKPFIERRAIYKNHTFETSQSGRQRSVLLFANHRTNLALDPLSLVLSKADDITERADVEAFKIWDIREQNPGVEFVVLCQFSRDPALERPSDDARRTLLTVGATVATDPDECADLFLRAVEPRSPNDAGRLL